MIYALVTLTLSGEVPRGNDRVPRDYVLATAAGGCFGWQDAWPGSVGG